MVINSASMLSDTVLYIRNFLIANLVDPIALKRPSSEKWIFTSFPSENITYPIITVNDDNTNTIKRLGMQSSMQSISFTIQIRIWARNVAERDTIFNTIYNKLRTQEFLTSGSREIGLHDFVLENTVNVDEEGPQGIKSKILRVKYMYVTQ